MYDAIVVGARCAGAPTAMLLARQGCRVLLLDKSQFPSDVVSTHIVWPHGAEVLDRWGLYEALAATGCPPIGRRMVFDVGPFALEGAVADRNGGRGGFCPRRTVLDKLLVDAAVAHGAELRERFTVDELRWEDGKVIGIAGHSHGGRRVEEQAQVVIGADGKHSLVARSVEAASYEAAPPIATYYYTYFSGFAADDVEQYVRDGHAVGCFPTHDGLTLIVTAWPSQRFPEIRANLEREAARAHASAPSVADRLRAAKRVDKWVGTAGVANYFRKPFGRGWALVGDAGYDKDPITAQGISDAFIDAEQLSAALVAGWSGQTTPEKTLADYQAQRDERARPMYGFTCEMAKLTPPPPPMQQLFRALHGDRETTNQFYSAITGASPLPAFMNPDNIGRIIGRAAGKNS